MFGYINGSVKIINSNNIIIETHGIGYIVNVSNPYSFEIDKDYILYLYNHVREDENTLYGFKTVEEKELFMKLINVKGLGPKTAIVMFSSGSVSGIVDAIERENILYLKKYPKIGDKLARQIILDLKGKLNLEVQDNNPREDLIDALLALGYKINDIKKVIAKVSDDISIEDQIKESLKLMLK